MDNMINRLRSVGPEERALLMQEVYERNIAFFQKKYPDIITLIKKVNCPYGINMTSDFLEIYNEENGEIAHPTEGLDKFSEMMGDWTHGAWVDLFNLRVVSPEKYPIHHRPVKEIHRHLLTSYPEFSIRFAQKKLNLKEIGDGRRFSPPVVFLGIFSGLHIDYFLSRSECAFILLIEPDLQRFEVSLYFLDYEAIDSKCFMSMSIGPETNSTPIQSFFNMFNVSRLVWTRVLPGYVHEKNPLFIESLRTLQTGPASVVYPIDYELKGLRRASKNIKAQTPLLTKRPQLSKKSRICIVATGPSLNNDLVWLKKNKSKLIIFALQSSVKVLRRAGIKPDFQFSLEAIMPQGGLEQLEPFYDVPWIGITKAPKVFSQKFKELLLCGIANKASHVKCSIELPFVAPSSLNLAFSFACYCQPSHIYLLGCDLSKPHGGKYYAKGSATNVTSEDETVNYEKMSKGLIEPNFKESGFVETNPFFFHTKSALERAIRGAYHNATIVNMSDGAMIEGARPLRSKNVRIESYKQKAKDIATIRGAFSPAKEKLNWEYYSKSGDQFFLDLREGFYKNLELEEFDWKKFNERMDRAFIDAEQIVKSDDSDLRGEVFVRLCSDLLASLYITCIFFDENEKAAVAYRDGVGKIKEILDRFEWPTEQ